MHLLDSKLDGAVNVAGPTPATSDEVTEAFAAVMHRPHLLRVPSFAVKALGEAGSRLLLDDANVVPARLLGRRIRLDAPDDHGRDRAIA